MVVQGRLSLERAPGRLPPTLRPFWGVSRVFHKLRFRSLWFEAIHPVIQPLLVKRLQVAATGDTAMKEAPALLLAHMPVAVPAEQGHKVMEVPPGHWEPRRGAGRHPEELTSDL